MRKPPQIVEIIGFIRAATSSFERHGTCSMIDGISAWYWTRKVLNIRQPRFLWEANLDQAVIAMALAAHVLNDGALVPSRHPKRNES